ncbi:MAG: hypothetical protein AAFP26_01555 [Planctomycetota bacterium]
MSAVSSTGAGQSQLLQFLQSQGAGGSRPGGLPGRDQLSSAVSSAASDAGLSAEQTDQLKSDIAEAVKSGLQGGDPASVRSSVESLLQDAGIDPESVRDALPGGGPGGAGRSAFAGFESGVNAANPSTTQQDLLQELLDSLGSGDEGETGSGTQPAFAGVPVGSFYDYRA